MTSPLVSCIMPTCDRRPFVAQAIRYFQRQDYPERELIILDDGDDRIADLVPDDPGIRYLRQKPRATVGAKRNRACREARGEILVHWDDDDWMAPWRLTYQVEELLAAGADVCGLDQLYFYEPRSDRGWRYVYPENLKPWVAGGTLCYTRAFWERNPFPEVNVGEDNRFVFRHRDMRLVRLADQSFYVALVHPCNTSRKQTQNARWQPRDAGEVRRLLGDDEAFYLGLRPASAKPAAPARRETAGSGSPGNQHVTVSIPYYRCADSLRRAVDSILAQTHCDLTLVVANDGDEPPWPLLEDIDDPRLVRFDLERNRGRYFVDEVVVRATESPFLLIQDADDWSEPHRLASLLRQTRIEHAAGAVSASRHHHQNNRGTTVVKARRWGQPLTDRLEHRFDHSGLFRTAAIRAVGGYYGGFRVGYDTLLTNFLQMTGRLAYVAEPLYHRVHRADSLTRSADTGMRSPARQKARKLLNELYLTAFEIYLSYLAGDVDQEELCRRLAALANRHVAAEEAAALEHESSRLRSLLRGARQAPPAPAARRAPASRPTRARKPVSRRRAKPPAVASPGGLRLEDPRLRWCGWSLGLATARRLRDRLEELRPRRVLEVGSGTSTVLLADYAARHGARLTSLDHDARYHRATRSLLRRFGLEGRVDLKLAPLAPRRCTDGKIYPWYRAELEGRFDFVLIDGPPESEGREACLFAVAPHLGEGSVVWLHDGARPHERRCIELWRRHYRFDAELSLVDPRGLLELRGVAAESAAASVPGPTISNLREGQPALVV